MKEIIDVQTTGHYDVSTGWLVETTTTYYSDGTSTVEYRVVDTHQPGWDSNAN